MELLLVDNEEYFKIIGPSYNNFNNSKFNNINKKNAEKVFYFLFKNSKYRLGLIAGLKNNILMSPFSAPFGGFSFKKSDVKIDYLDKALILLEEWAQTNKIFKIKFILPPLFYHGSFIAKEINSLFRANYTVDQIDLNFHFETKFLDKNYEQKIWYSAKKSLNRSRNNNLIFQKCQTISEKELAFKIIEKNRNTKGFPLRMNLSDINITDEIIKKDFFLVFNDDNKPAASAIVYYLTHNTVQVVYWGDDPNYSELRLMNFLSYNVFEYYKKANFKNVDIGPSTEKSKPNYGLCEFKEGIGCNIFPKYTFSKEIN